MNNPSINRWGFNLFWYKMWYTDRIYSKLANQDNIFQKLIYLYLNYGVLYPENPFLNNYWHPYIWNTTEDFFINHNTKYYRVARFRSVAMNIDSTYFLRIKLKNIHASRIWLLRYHGWLIINFYCFQPTINSSRKHHPRYSIKKDRDFFLTNMVPNYSELRRSKMLLTFVFSKSISNVANYYSF
jgi:hypothetical protein